MDTIFKSINETSKASGLATCHIRKLVAEGKAPYIKSGNKILIDYEKFIEGLRLEASNED